MVIRMWSTTAEAIIAAHRGSTPLADGLRAMADQVIMGKPISPAALRMIAERVAKVERAWDEVVADAMEDGGCA